MTKKKMLVFYDKKEKTNIIYFLNNIDYKQYDIDLIIEDSIGNKKEIPKKVNIIKYNKNIIKKHLFKIKFKFQNKNKYDATYLFSSDNLLGNYLVRTTSKNSIIFIKSNNINNYNYREYFIKRHIYEFNKIIFKTYEEQDIFLKHYPSLSKKTCVINDFVNYEEIEKLSQEEIKEKIKKTDKTILLISELNEEKNKILNILKLIKSIKGDIKNIKLYIIGDGIDKGAYESFIQDNQLDDTIYLLGKKTNIYPYIEKCRYTLINNKSQIEKVLYASVVLNTHVISRQRYKDDIIDLGNNFEYVISSSLKHQREELLNILKTTRKKQNFNFNNINKDKIRKILKNNNL